MVAKRAVAVVGEEGMECSRSRSVAGRKATIERSQSRHGASRKRSGSRRRRRRRSGSRRRRSGSRRGRRRSRRGRSRSRGKKRTVNTGEWMDAGSCEWARENRNKRTRCTEGCRAAILRCQCLSPFGREGDPGVLPLAHRDGSHSQRSQGINVYPRCMGPLKPRLVGPPNPHSHTG